MIARLRGYLIAGLLVWVPLGITFLVVKFLVDLMDRSMVLVPPAWRPEELIGVSIPGLGFALTFIIVIITGVLVANLVGRRLVGAWESLLARIPLVRTIYSVVKQVVQTVLSTNSSAFRQVLLVPYPSKGMWSIGFMSSEGSTEIQDGIAKEVITVYVPHAPNITSGFIVMVPKDEVIVLDMPVEDGMKMVMSLGVVTQPPNGRLTRPETEPEPEPEPARATD